MNSSGYIKMRDFKKLEIWQRGVHIAKDIYLLTATIPAREKFGLCSQIQRASVSIASNIAEGAARNSEADFAGYLEIALGSSFEVETQLFIAKEIEYITTETLQQHLDKLEILQKPTNQLIQKLRKSMKANRY
jgi:four helix bundle protein